MLRLPRTDCCQAFRVVQPDDFRDLHATGIGSACVRIGGDGCHGDLHHGNESTALSLHASGQFNRREVLAGGAGVLGLTAAKGPTESGSMPRRTVGRSGEQVSMLGLGGSHIGAPDSSELLICVRRSPLYEYE